MDAGSFQVIRRYGTHSVMRVGLNQPIMRELLEKMMEPTESDGMTDSVTEISLKESTVVRDQPVKRTKKGLKKYKTIVRKLKSRVKDKTINPKDVKSKAATVVM